METNNMETNNINKKRKFRGVLSYVVVGALSITLGGFTSLFATLYVLPNTNLFKNAPIYSSLKSATENLVSTVYDGHPTQLKTDSSAMSVTDINKKVAPAVVAITAYTNSNGKNTPLGVGSGMIINSEGYILTNYHVIKGATSIKVLLSNNKEASGKIINYDSNYDVAIVKITDSTLIPAFVELGDSDTLEVGNNVVAIGNPLGTEFLASVTAGVVSALNRTLDGDPNKLAYIQTDTAINSGNSGGPLINNKGQVIGINTAKIKESGVEGLSFAIPINAIKDKIKNLSIPILLLGIQGREVTKNNLPIGVYIDLVTNLSPADVAGIKAGDVITSLGDQKITTFAEINTIKNKHKAGDKISITVNRNGKDLNLTLTFSSAS